MKQSLFEMGNQTLTGQPIVARFHPVNGIVCCLAITNLDMYV